MCVNIAELIISWHYDSNSFQPHAELCGFATAMKLYQTKRNSNFQENQVCIEKYFPAGLSKVLDFSKASQGVKTVHITLILQIKNEPTESRTILEVILEEYPCLEKPNKLNTLMFLSKVLQ